LRDIDALGFLDLVCGAVADENGLSAPFDENLYPSVYGIWPIGYVTHVFALGDGG